LKQPVESILVGNPLNRQQGNALPSPVREGADLAPEMLRFRSQADLGTTQLPQTSKEHNVFSVDQTAQSVVKEDISTFLSAENYGEHPAEHSFAPDIQGAARAHDISTTGESDFAEITATAQMLLAQYIESLERKTKVLEEGLVEMYRVNHAYEKAFQSISGPNPILHQQLGLPSTHQQLGFDRVDMLIPGSPHEGSKAIPPIVDTLRDDLPDTISHPQASILFRDSKPADHPQTGADSKASTAEPSITLDRKDMLLPWSPHSPVRAVPTPIQTLRDDTPDLASDVSDVLRHPLASIRGEDRQSAQKERPSLPIDRKEMLFPGSPHAGSRAIPKRVETLRDDIPDNVSHPLASLLSRANATTTRSTLALDRQNDMLVAKPTRSKLNLMPNSLSATPINEQSDAAGFICEWLRSSSKKSNALTKQVPQASTPPMGRQKGTVPNNQATSLLTEKMEASAMLNRSIAKVKAELARIEKQARESAEKEMEYLHKASLVREHRKELRELYQKIANDVAAMDADFFPPCPPPSFQTESYWASKAPQP
jgi:hypothetical protein